MRKRDITWGLAALLMGTLAVSCTEVDFSDSSETNPKATFELSWPTEEYTVQSDSLLIVASRIVDTWRSAMIVNSVNGNGEILYPEVAAEETTTTNETEGGNTGLTATLSFADNWSAFPLKNGDFDILATTAKESVFSFSNVNELEKDFKTKLTDIKTAYKLFPATSSRILNAGENWDDINQYSESAVYMDNTAGPICTLRNDFIEINPNKTNTIALTGEYVSQRINLTFQARVEEGINIQSTLAELAGIPVAVYPGSAGFLKEQTCKVIVRPEMTSQINSNESITIGEGDTQTSINTNLVTFKTTVDVISWIRNDKNNAVNGAGILSIALNSNYTEGGSYQNKVYQAKINLYNTLSRSNPTEYAGKAEGKTVYKNKNILVDIDISDIITITKQGAISTSANVQPDKWMVNE